jgi:hypothetical protein
MEEKISATNVEMAIITPHPPGVGNLNKGYGVYRVLSKEENEVLIKTLSEDPFDKAIESNAAGEAGMDA